ncbi:helix-turn-helix transcriptional regulator [Christiangramia sabulilitoris]|uniref:Helix-turn-helix transcriptional regulator n=1 Tax=Christiangramia sabulilitoris TaxID=2583991 RepID=A0A550I2L8_9FLAO|nr:AraC family transcriptional regulator [Christiangramia sabulilitoris]TRO65068.1 helix-turn-helix transcriptional regulator [Christiangramia sabulilitoris]
MKTYHLELNDVDDIIPELANHFGTVYQEELGEYNLGIPASIGEGTISVINFPNGIGLHTYQCTFKEDTQFILYHLKVKPIRFIYCLEGVITSDFGNNQDTETLQNHEYLIAAPKSDETHNLCIPGNKEVNLCYLEIDRVKFQEYFSFDLKDLEPVFFELFSDTKAGTRISEKSSFSLKTAETIKEIKNTDIQGFPRINFIGAKALEILSYMLTQFKKGENSSDTKKLKEKDIKAIEKAVDYIDTNISNTGTVNDLAKIAGVNTNKLQEGFQSIFGKTVNEYIRDIRLTRALNILSAGNKNVSEVVYELGLSSRSYFSKIFKEKYGISPRKILARRTVNKKLEEN